MLRWVIGDSSFFAGLKNYLNDPTLRYSFATTQDFKTHMENSSGMNLTGFFNDWFFGEGYPTYDITCIKKPNQIIETTINQTQSHPSVGFYEMPVPVKFKNTTKDTIVVFNNIANSEVFSTQLNFVPDSVFFDPDLRIVSKNSSIHLGIESINNDSYLEIFPNPTKNILNIHYSNIKISKIEITDVLGKNCFEKEISGSNLPAKLQINLEKFQSGNYFLKCYSENEIIIKKIIRL
jgi:hypothetical protein